jgi:hypothetical protein
MALEPKVATLSDAPNPELVDMTRRFWIAAALGAPVFLLTMGDMLTGGAIGARVGPGFVNWIGLVLATPVVLWAGAPFFHRMWASFRNASPNMFTLIGLGVGAAFAYSAVATAAPALFPASLRMHHGQVDTYFDTTIASCSGSRRRPRDWSSPPRPASLRAGLKKSTFRWTSSRSATSFACGPATKSPWTASSWTAAARSTSRW